MKIVKSLLCLLTIYACLSAHYVSCEELPSKTKPMVSLTRAEKIWLNDHLDIMLGFTEYEPYLTSSPDGTISGVLVDFLDELNRRLGTNINLSVDSLPKVIDKVKNKELDGILALHPEYSAKQGLLYTSNYIKAYSALFANRDLVLNTPEDMADKTIVHREKEYYSQIIIDQYGKNAKVLKVKTVMDGLRMVYRGGADIFVGLSANTSLISKYQLSGLVPKYIFINNPQSFGIAIRSDWPEFVSILNKGLASFSEKEIDSFIAMWIHKPKQPQKIALTPAEKTWLSKNNNVQVHFQEHQPFLISTEDGYSGIVVEYLKLIGQRTGIHFEFSSQEHNISKTLKSLEAHTGVDVIPSIDSSETKKAFSIFSMPYHSSPRVIITREDEDFIAGIGDLKTKRISVTTSSLIVDLLKDAYPELNLIFFQSPEESIKAVATGETDATISNLIFASHLIKSQGLSNLKIAAPSSLPDQLFSFAIRKDWPELASIINKGLATISLEEQSQIRNRFISLRYEQTNIALITKWFLIILGSATGILLLFIFWNRSLTKRVSSKTMEIKKSKDTLLESERKYHQLYAEMVSGAALHEIICDDNNKPVDYRTLEINKAYESLLGVRREDVIGKTFRELVPTSETDWVEMFGKVALTGQSMTYEQYFPSNKNTSKAQPIVLTLASLRLHSWTLLNEKRLNSNYKSSVPQ